MIRADGDLALRSADVRRLDAAGIAVRRRYGESWTIGEGMTMRAMMAGALVVLVLTGPAWAQRDLPDPGLTPGAINPAVTQDDIGATICARGWTRTIRPPAQYTDDLKRRQIREYGYADRRLRSYEEDHLIPLSIGGSPDDPRNLWPEPRQSVDGWDADRKDDLEFVLNHLVCDGAVPLAEAQHAIASDWIAAYRRYVAGQ